ncbi:MAG TPA: 50S ribosomal protein L7/L12 [Chloroflexota bacterium]|jgi:large subunit ribosomal protein L7/L12|nr:50S ribosomal protein L7/L12 [Chloroflexota bacterium]
MALTTEQLLDEIGNMTLFQVADLVKAMEDRLGVKAAAPVAVGAAAPAAAGNGAAPAEAPAEPTEFTATLTEVGPNKINVIKAVRELVPGLGLKEAKDLVDTAPKPIKESVSKDEAEAVRVKLADVGATVSITAVG